jgi:hypothetical protein
VTRLVQALDGVAELLFGHSRPPAHAQPSRFTVEIFFGRFAARTGFRPCILAVGSAPERLAHVDEESSELVCDAARMAVEYFFDVIETARHPPSLPPNSQLDRRRLPSKGL